MCPIFALAAAVFVVLLLAACGGSDSSTSDSNSTESSSARSEAGSQGNGAQAQNRSRERRRNGGRQDGGEKGQQNRSASQEQAADKSSKRHSVKEVSVPLKVSGGGSEQFIVKGGDNSIQEFGKEGDESELQAAAEAVHDFYVARAVGDWPGACSHLAASMVEQLEQLGEQSPQVGGKGCAPILAAFTKPLPASAWREITVVDAASLRREGEQAFLLYRGAKGTNYAMPIRFEGGAWLMTSLAAAEVN